MRKKPDGQRNFFHVIPDAHEIGQELAKISELIDANPEIIDIVHNDLVRENDENNGRNGMSADQILRCALLKQYRQLTYDELAFHLQDSRSFQAFARIGVRRPPSASALQANIKRISDYTWKKANDLLVRYACEQRLETGRVVRVDSTATATNIHYPTDSTLLWDAIRVITEALIRSKNQFPSLKNRFMDHRRAAKKHMTEIQTNKRHEKESERKGRYKELLKYASSVHAYAQSAIVNLREISSTSALQGMQARAIVENLERNSDLLAKVIKQTRLRVIDGKKVPSCAKVCSMFESHTDIIAKGNRETAFGHKLFLSGGKSGLILDCQIERGNPADASKFCDLLNRQVELFGRPPRQMAGDGGFASKENLLKAKSMGVKDVAFAKRRGISVLEMVKSNWVYKKLRNFRAGIEANISVLKRGYGLFRCDWRGWLGYLKYVHSSVLAYNFTVLARLTLLRAQPNRA